jgi:phage head maturation protease
MPPLPTTLTATALTATTVTLSQLSASVNPATRTITGLIAPYGIPGRTSLGALAVAPGALSWDTDLRRVKLTLEHDRNTPIGYLTGITDTGAGIQATWHIAATAAGDAALLEAAEGVRDGLSIDLVDVSVEDGVITRGTLVAVGLCSVPAYADARVSTVAATTPQESPPAPHPVPVPVPAATTPPVAVPQTPPAPPPAVAVTGATPPARTAPRDSLALVAGMIAAAARGDMAPAQLSAALANFTTLDQSGGAALPPQWVGQLWTEAAVGRAHVDAITGPRPLTSLKVQGWQWIDTLAVGAWTGDKTQIPTNAPRLGPAEETAGRWAGGVDVAREFFDLGAGDIVRDLMVQATSDYKRQTDLACLADLISGATPASATTAAEALGAIRAGLGAIRRKATWVGLAGDLFDEIASTPGPGPAYLSGSINGDAGTVGATTFVYDPDMPAGTAMGLVTDAATFYEKGPVQVDALNIALGGVDEAVFGYTATLVNRAAAIIYVTVATLPLGRSGSKSD